MYTVGHRILPRVTFVFMLLFCAINSNAQHNWQIGFYYPLLEQLDVNPNIQANLSPSLFNIRRADVLNEDLTSLDTIWKVPFAFGMHIQKKIKKSWVSIDFLSQYGANLLSPYYKLKPNGMRGIHFNRLSIVYTKPIKLYKKGSLSYFFGPDFRWGIEYYGANFIPGTHHYPARHLYDLGASGGMTYQWFPISHLGVNLQAGFRQWLFLYAHVVDRVSVKGPRSELEIKLGMSYQFGKKVDISKMMNE